MPFDSDGERRRERITRSHDNREALPLDRVWKAEQIGGGKAISRHLSALAAMPGAFEVRLGWVGASLRVHVISCFLAA